MVGYQSDGANWTLSVGDDGVGMPTASEAVAKPGLGTSIVEALARQMHAQVQVIDASPGTKVSLIHAQRVARAAETSDAV